MKILLMSDVHIEFGGLLLKCFVLAVRLFANMFAGHIVLGTILLFIPMVKNSGPGIATTVTMASVIGVLALSFLELFVAFLQAFLFAFLFCCVEYEFVSTDFGKVRRCDPRCHVLNPRW